MIRSYERKAAVLMYHRVAELESDVWRLAVSTMHFEQHLQLLKRKWNVVPLAELVKGIGNGTLKSNSVAITFDDGYADNFINAKPLLEKYQLPATFFVSSGDIGRQAEFWWDELERMLLLSKELPRTLTIRIGNKEINGDLREEYQLNGCLQKRHRNWKAYEQDPPTVRCTLFLKLWEALKPLSHEAQQEIMLQLRNWAGVSFSRRPLYHSMSLEQVKEIGQNSLFQIGAHTVSHPDLAQLSATLQQQEILDNKAFLEEATGKEVNLLAYPYGSHNNDTVSVLASAGFTAAFTTNSSLVKPSSEWSRLGRLLVDDWSGEQLSKQMKMWMKC